MVVVRTTRKQGTRKTGYVRKRAVQPKRTYPRSLVPTASRGYRPNKIEQKVIDQAATSYNVNTSGVLLSLNIVNIGADFTQRIGRKICLTSVYIRGFVNIANAKTQPPTVSDVAAQHVRFLLLWDMQPNGAYPIVTDILASSSTNAPMNLNNRDRFKVIADKQFVFDPFIFDTATSTASCTNQIKPFKLYKKLNLEAIYNGSTGSVADITSGNLIAFWLGSDPSGLNGPVDFNGSYRVRFIDM